MEGNIQLKGSVNLDMDLPYPSDANYDYLECCVEYGADHGAKIWLVPSECYNSANMIVWPESCRFLAFVYTEGAERVVITHLGREVVYPVTVAGGLGRRQYSQVTAVKKYITM